MNINRILVFFILFLSGSLFCQQIKFEPSVKVTYQAVLKLGNQHNALEEDFVLIGNSSEYYFAAKQNYLNDTNQYVSDGGLDLKMISAYFKERILKTDKGYQTFISNFDGKIRYEENKPLKWVLYGDSKIINGKSCQLVTTNLFGRRWYAYFSTAYNQNIGPYKFSGLPGLILELYDQRNDYHFTAVSIEKNTEKFSFNLSGFKNFSKKDYLKARDNLLYGIGKFPGLSGDMLRQTEQTLEGIKIRGNNPIELKPFD